MTAVDTNHNLILQRLRGAPKLRKFATIDIEATEWVNAYAVGFYDGKEYTDFLGRETCIESALAHVLTPRYAGYSIYAHNGGNYDFLFFLRRLLVQSEFRNRFSYEITPIGSTIVAIHVTEKNGKHKPDCQDTSCKGCGTAASTKSAKRTLANRRKWTFIDSVRLMPLKLDELGKAFGLGRKVKLDMSYDDLGKPENQPKMREYLEADCVILHRALEKMQATINELGGQVGITLPATSLDTFRRRYQQEDIHINRHFRECPEFQKKADGTVNKEDDSRCKGCLHDFVRDAYFGGPAQIFRMRFEPYDDTSRPWSAGGGYVDKAELYDINSHYPAAMLEPMPVGDAFVLEGLSEKQVFANSARMVGMVDCDVEIPSDCYLPPLPVKSKEGKLIFPTGKLRGTWDAEELKLLPLVGGRIVRTRRSVWYESKPIFARFIRHLWQFRDKKRKGWNEGMDFIAKVLLNSLYGKFAMVEERSRILIAPESPLGLVCMDMAADVWSENIYIDPPYIVAQLSAHVTAVARVRLWELLTSILKQGGRIYYTDTDSVVCSGVTLSTGTGLGELKLESTITHAEFVLPKLYLVETVEKQKRKTEEVHTKVKAKGMGPGIRIGVEGDDPLDGQLSTKEFVDLVQTGAVLSRFRLTKLKESLRDYTKKSHSFPRVVPSPKQLRTVYDKRTVLENYDTAPLQVAAW
mgnify:CR=1 FL=1